MNIELDGIPLVKIDENPRGGQPEIRNVFNISTADRRDMVSHKIPGMEGDVFQNLGRSPVVISFDGTFQGKTAKENLETLRTKFKQGTPLPFNSDLSGAADITHVLVNDMRIEESNSVIGRYHYFMVLQEYKVPPPEPVMPPAQDEEAAEWQEQTAQDVVESINVITGKVLDGDGNPKSGVPVKVTGESGEYNAETDDEGMYRIEDVPPGTYKVTVDSEEFEGAVEEVTVGGEGESESAAGGEAGSQEEQESGEGSGTQPSSGDEGGSSQSTDASSSSDDASRSSADEGTSAPSKDASSSSSDASRSSADEGTSAPSKDAGGSSSDASPSSGDDGATRAGKGSDRSKSRPKQSQGKK